MTIVLVETPFGELKDLIIKNIKSYGTRIDSYYEDHVIESKHFRIVIDNVYAGYVSVFDAVLITQFYLEQSHLKYSREVFEYLLDQKAFTEVYVSTSDKQLLNLALDFQKEIAVQDCVFEIIDLWHGDSVLNLTRATTSDIEFITANHEGFFQNLQLNIDQGQLYIGKDKQKPVSFGIIEKSKVFSNQASIGMFVIKPERGNNYGSMTITMLIEECIKHDINPVAGCFSKNTYSRNALYKAGMINCCRLLKIKVSKETA